MATSPPNKQAQFALIMAAFAFVLALAGFLRIQGNPGEGSLLEYAFEAVLPGLLFVGLLWHGLALRRGGKRA